MVPMVSFQFASCQFKESLRATSGIVVRAMLASGQMLELEQRAF